MSSLFEIFFGKQKAFEFRVIFDGSEGLGLYGLIEYRGGDS
jgi:hypothetical protein